MGWLQSLLNSPDRDVRATAVPCPVCWAPSRKRCWRWNGKTRSWGPQRRARVHPERRQRLYRKTGLR